jgi:hypothetical protein
MEGSQPGTGTEQVVHRASGPEPENGEPIDTNGGQTTLQETERGRLGQEAASGGREENLAKFLKTDW